MDVNLYADYTLEDFLNDDDLIKWVKYPDEQNSKFWNSVLFAFPDKSGIIEQAVDIVHLLNLQIQPNTTALEEQVWQNIETDLNLKYNYSSRRVIKMWTRIAASIILVLSFGYSAYYLQQNSMKVFHAEYGAIKSLRLPDGSNVQLNSNSEVSYPQKWMNGRSRELWLKGEALFSVKHVALANVTSVADSFRVHVANLKVTVLGTEFNIKDRRNVIDITLARGKIRIDFDDQSHKAVYLLPGDAVQYDAITHHMLRTAGTGEAATAWTQRKLILSGNSLNDVIHVLEDNYGYQVILNDPTLGEKQLKGTIPLQKKNDLLFVIRKVFHVDIKQNGNTLTIY